LRPERLPEARRSLNQLQEFALGEVVNAATSAVELQSKEPPEVSAAGSQWSRFTMFLDSLSKLVDIERKLVELSEPRRSSGAPREALPWDV